MAFLEESLIFFPSKFPDGVWKPHGLDFEDAWFKAADGTELHGWYCPHENPRAVVLFAHGNAGNLSHRYERLRHFQLALDCSVMIFDYRGYGRSAGQPTETGILADARAARSWLAQRASVAEQAIVLLGESIGGAVMVDLAAREPPRGLVLENTFSSLPEVAAFHYPWLPVRLILKTRLNSWEKIENCRGPLLMCHGDADTIVPLRLAEKLYQRANEPKQLIVTPGGDHNDPPSQAYLAALGKFLTHLP